MNRKGQALVEFVLILPIFIMLLFVIIDFGIIFSSKMSLENTSSDIVLMIKNGDDVNSINSFYKDIDIDISSSGKYYNVLIEKEIDLITPFLGDIMGEPYVISVKKVVVND